MVLRSNDFCVTRRNTCRDDDYANGKSYLVLHSEGTLHVAACLEVGTVSQGATMQEAVANLREATALYLEEFPFSGAPFNSSITP